jgi:hypothetical protein
VNRLRAIAASHGRRPKPLDLALYVEAPLIGLAWFLWHAIRQHAVAVDLRYSFLPAAHAVVHGLSPFPVSHAAVLRGTAYLYPPLTAWLTTPLLLLPAGLAAWVGVAVGVAAAFGALWLFDVRDWRCYGAIFIWKPTLLAVQTANLSLLLLLATAIAWRYRERLAGAASVGAATAAKLFLWPLLIWLIATRRYRLAGWAATAATAFLVVPWAALSFSGLRAYPGLARYADRIEGPRSYTIAALVERIGGSANIGLAVSFLVLAALIAGVFVAGRRGDDRLSLTLALVAALLCAPIAWLHYYVLLAAPLAIYRPQFSRAWLVPLALWVCLAVNGGAAPPGPAWQTVLAVATPLILTLLLAVAPAPPLSAAKRSSVIA